MDKRSKVCIVYMMRGSNIGTNFLIQSYNAIDVHAHSDEAIMIKRCGSTSLTRIALWCSAIETDKLLRKVFQKRFSRIILIGRIDNYVHEKENTRKSIKSNLINCGEAKKFYNSTENLQHAFKDCMKTSRKIIIELASSTED